MDQDKELTVREPESQSLEAPPEQPMTPEERARRKKVILKAVLFALLGTAVLYGLIFLANYLSDPYYTVRVTNYNEYTGVEEMSSEADLIAAATVTSSPKFTNYRTKTHEGFDAVGGYNTVQLHIDRCFAGDAAEDIILRDETRCTVDCFGSRTLHLVDGSLPLKRGHQYLLFLEKAEDGSYSILRKSQGKFAINSATRAQFSQPAGLPPELLEFFEPTGAYLRNLGEAFEKYLTAE